ncbi:transglycosylase SLT domain-containing protein [Bailinhaonella thermotolerans]|uniref:Lytic transglycosylase n=1 Tax=Bailinhaonella thermotolerans TaxID=1070861 RepID=A0A3A4AVD6_9ACTN|nr:transglycosylase SLT domain-containing protein [Bailinhaonella thermotolerans]RJL30037.1 lytic transglycosylase [Bailinhaonella thermotolerans]
MNRVSGADLLAGLPSGPAFDAAKQRLTALADKVDGDPEAVRALATRWSGAGGNATEYAGGVQRKAANVDALWAGASADAFRDHVNALASCGEALDEAVRGCAQQLRQVASALETAKSEVTAICSDLVTRVSAVDRTAKDADTRISGMIDDAAKRAEVPVGRAERAAEDAAGRIGELLGRLETRRFSRLLAAHRVDPVFAKASFDWRPVPPPSPTATTAAYSGGPSPDGSGGFGGYGPSGAPPGKMPEGRVADWIREAIEILKAHGYPVEKMNPDHIYAIIMHESSGNPHAINLTDGNAAAGTPSKGLMQTIDPTFNAYSLPGHKNIYDPVDNIIAGVRYAISRYGSVSNVPGLHGLRNGSGYEGY